MLSGGGWSAGGQRPRPRWRGSGSRTCKEGGFHRMCSGYVSEGLETMVETGPDLHFKTTVLHCLERRSGGGGPEGSRERCQEVVWQAERDDREERWCQSENT